MLTSTAALSGDPAMMAAYRSGDPYLTFAIQAGAVPATATKKTYEFGREQFKACVLAVRYGMGEASWPTARSAVQSKNRPPSMTALVEGTRQHRTPKVRRYLPPSR